MSDDIYILWLTRIQGIGLKKIEALLQHFKQPSKIWLASLEELSSVNHISCTDAERIISNRKKETVERWIEELEKKNIQFISICNPQYPSLLKQIYDPPSGLYIKGTLPKEGIKKISIVGARRCSQYGINVTFQLSKELAEKGFTIVSGMARGIDTIANKGALAVKKPTIAVLGCGVDVCYPAENKNLMQEIIENGCVISEYPPGTYASAVNFPKRNRIIAGISTATIIVEATQKSGALITVNQAIENGREVFAVPGNITSALSQGTNELIKQGCPMITNVNDVLFELGITYNEEEKKKCIEKDISGLAKEEKTVYDCINLEPISADDIANRLNQSIQEIQTVLSLLEIYGYIKKLPQSGYVREI